MSKNALLKIVSLIHVSKDRKALQKRFTISQSFVDTSEYDDVYKQDVNGIECVIGEQEERVYCSFAYKDSVYRIICNAGKEATISIIQTMIKGDVL